ncbi:MAG: SDR family oxidoreductase [Chloroflexi bacterium]|nr:SDR family oxidoreductase [Chloroflexota bacterium]
MNLNDKTALITGASRGIGQAIAQRFAAAGSRVAVHYHQNRSAAEATFKALSGQGHILIQADITKPDEVQRMVETSIEQLGGLDILVNNAGAGFENHSLVNIDYKTWQDSWRQTIHTNLIGAANACYCAVRHMIERKSGKIINVGSRGAYRGEPLSPAYGASKAGLHALSQSLAKYLGQYNVFVTAVAPGFVETDMSYKKLTGSQGNEIRNQSPLERVATPEEVAHTVLFLAAPGSEWLTGGVVDLNGASYLR